MSADVFVEFGAATVEGEDVGYLEVVVRVGGAAISVFSKFEFVGLEREKVAYLHNLVGVHAVASQYSFGSR